MGRKRKKRTSRHHVIPRSRGGTNKLENMAKIDKRKHEYYHALFNNRTPPEIVNLLVKKYWNGNWDYVRNAYKDHYRS